MRAIIKAIELVPGIIAQRGEWLYAHPYVLMLMSSAALAIGAYHLGRFNGRDSQRAADAKDMAKLYSTGYADAMHVRNGDPAKLSKWADLGYVSDDGITEQAACPLSPPVRHPVNVTAMSLTDGALIVEGTIGDTLTRTLVPHVADARMSFGFDNDPGARFTGVAGMSVPGEIVTEDAARRAVDAWNAERGLGGE